MIETVYRGLGHAVERIPGLLPQASPGDPCDVLVHAASAGEVKAAVALRAAATDDLAWTITAGSPIGADQGADRRTPRDVPGATARLLDETAPRLLLLVEAELWPTLLAEAHRRSIPVAVVSARITPSAARAWGRVPASVRRAVWGRVAFWGAASAGDAGRIRALGVPTDRVETTGLLKFPAPVPTSEVGARRDDIEAMFGDRPGPLLVLGSAHPGEARDLADRARGTPLAPDVSRWLIVPRHRIRRRLRREARSLGAALEHRFGVLPSWYAAADAAFVGGGARGRGVHDLLEPVAAGRRPLFFARRGDPADCGARLVARGAAVDLDVAGSSPGDALAPGVPFGPLRDAWDGRDATLAALRRRGLLP